MTMKQLQQRVREWVLECFGDEISCDRLERMDRFVEEALERVQASGYTADRVIALTNYVFARPPGDPFQETGGTLTTLAALCNIDDIDIERAFRIEVKRITQPEMVERIRAKRASKQPDSPLPTPPVVQRVAQTEYVDPLDAAAVRAVDFSTTSRVHDWRTHIGSATRKLWPTFSDAQRLALAADAEERSNEEPWD